MPMVAIDTIQVANPKDDIFKNRAWLVSDLKKIHALPNEKGAEIAPKTSATIIVDCQAESAESVVDIMITIAARVSIIAPATVAVSNKMSPTPTALDFSVDCELGSNRHPNKYRIVHNGTLPMIPKSGIVSNEKSGIDQITGPNSDPKAAAIMTKKIASAAMPTA